VPLMAEDAAWPAGRSGPQRLRPALRARPRRPSRQQQRDGQNCDGTCGEPGRAHRAATPPYVARRLSRSRNRDRQPAGIGGTAASGRGKAARNPRKHDTPRTPWQDVIASTLRGTSKSREGLNSTGEARRYRSLLIGSLGRQAWATEISRHHSVTICRWLASLRAAPWQLL